MSSELKLLKKQISELEDQLEVEMAKNANVSDGALPICTGQKNHSETNSSLGYQKTKSHWESQEN